MRKVETFAGSGIQPKRRPVDRTNQDDPKSRPAGGAEESAQRPQGEGREKPKGPAIEVEDVHVSFGEPGSGGEKVVLDGISLKVDAGEAIAILGESGGGKTVLLRVILGLLEPQKGRVRLLGTDVIGLSDEELEPLRRRISVVLQNSALYSGMTVEENIALELSEVLDLPQAEIDKRVKESLAAVGLEEVKPDQAPDELSGGMKKRVAVARAVAPHPEMIFYDEPTSGLDPMNSARILDLIHDLHVKQGVTSIVVTHDIDGASKIAGRIVLLAKGKVAFDGTPEEFAKSSDPAVDAFRKAAPGFAASRRDAAKKRAATREGAVENRAGTPPGTGSEASEADRERSRGAPRARDGGPRPPGSPEAEGRPSSQFS